MDCTEVMRLLAEEHQTLTAQQDVCFQEHLVDCTACRELAGAHSDIATMATGYAVTTPPTELSLPTVDPSVFAKGAVLAKGGMGRITRAMDLRLGREVAIKEVLSPSFRARFEREALITARLQHPAIVPIYEAGTWPDGSAFYTMRLVWGTTLQKAIAERDTLETRLALLPQVIAAVEALGYAHSRRVVHRDLKPGNILVGEFGETVVIDWGLAKEIDGVEVLVTAGTMTSAPDLTHAGSVMGTPCFMSPEQAAGEALDERADVYALGAILYDLLVGHPPHWDTTEHSADRLVDAARNDQPTSLAKLAPRAPVDLRAIIERAMARSPDDRYRTGKEMAEELRRFEAGQLIGSREYTLRDLIARWLRKHRTAVVVATVAVVVVAVVGIGSIVNVMRSRAAERDAREAADKARTISDANMTSLLEEQGRAAIVAGDRERAIPYLVEARARGHDGVAIRHLVAEATRDHDVLDYVTQPMHHEITSVGYAADGTLVTVDMFDASIAQSHGAANLAIKPIGKTIDASRLSPDVRR
ncbi:MAG TPA: serine/threonine-protein kinase, partial [Kofleriaceae bacterium]|nr:serine/threonine-protein kinase [Kofleriaceae bacterium]